MAIREWARNEIRAQKKEGDDEKFVGWAQTTYLADKEDEQLYHSLLREGRSIVRLTTKFDEALHAVQTDAKATGGKYSNIFYSHGERFLRTLLHFPLHFRPTKLFTLSYLNQLIEIHGGVRIFNNSQ